MFPKAKEDTSGAFMVESYISLSVDAKIIHKDFKPMFRDHVGKNVVHKCLERGWGIAEPEEHYCGFKESEGGDECSLLLVCFSNSDVIVPPVDVELGEQGGIFHVVNEFRDKW